MVKTINVSVHKHLSKISGKNSTRVSMHLTNGGQVHVYTGANLVQKLGDGTRLKATVKAHKKGAMVSMPLPTGGMQHLFPQKGIARVILA